jgi:hypothetical protein
LPLPHPAIKPAMAAAVSHVRGLKPLPYLLICFPLSNWADGVKLVVGEPLSTFLPERTVR